MIENQSQNQSQPQYQHKISIIMPAYNAAKTIQRAIDSIVAQAGWHELIIVDDASSDETWQIIQDNQQRFGNIKAFRHHQNMGAAAARNLAVTQASGDILGFLDADDEHAAGFYQFTQNTFAANAGLAALKVGTEFHQFPAEFTQAEFQEKRAVLLNTFIPNLMVYKSCYEFLGGFSTHPVLQRDGGEDGVFCYLLAQLFSVGTYYDASYLIHHWHPNVHAERFLKINPDDTAAQNSEVVQVSYAIIQERLAQLKHLKSLLQSPEGAQTGFLPLILLQNNAQSV